MVTSFTPGPWRVHRSELTGAPIIAAGNKSIAWPADAPTDADAHLIAAAPDLYAALELMVAHFGDPLKVARAALDKARGEV